MVASRPFARKRRGDNSAGKNFAKGGDVIGGARGQLAYRSNPAQQFVECFEVGSQISVKFREKRRAEQFSSGVIVALAQRARKT